MAHIEIRNLGKRYKNRRRQPRMGDGSSLGQKIELFKDLNLSIGEGEVVCILGPSGCGKSTLLRLIAGFERPTEGEILIHGQRVTGPRPDSIFVFQHSGLLPWMTLEENVGLGLRALCQQSRHQRVAEFLEMVDLVGFGQHFPHQLSGGMQRRAELARALIVNPCLLIMDEPFSGLDFLTHMRVREEVVNMHQLFEKTTLLVTHDINDALIMGDRVIVISDRPATILLDEALPFGRPRIVKTQSQLGELRERIFLMLGVSDVV